MQGAVGESARADSKSSDVARIPRLLGAVFRVWAGERWLEAATSDLSDGALGRTVEILEQELGKLSLRGDPPGTASTLRAERSNRPAHPVADLGADGLLSRAKEARDWALAAPSISEAQARVSWSDDTRLYLNSAGARCLQTIHRAHWVLVPIAMENGKAQADYDLLGAEGGQEILDALNEQMAKELAQGSKELLDAKSPPAGEMAVLLDPSVAGLFAHESFGHGTEADQFARDRSYLRPLLGQEVGPPSLTIADDGSAPNAWGTIFFDDEGHPGQKTKLVDRGQFSGALHDRETAALFSARATGNTRRSDFLSRAYVRMTNTYVEPGELSLEELVAETKNGVLLERGTSGIEDPLGGQMQLKVRKGHLIENGRTTDLVGSMALSGSVLAFLRSIRGVGKADGGPVQAGSCGKGHGDYLPVGTGGAYLLSQAVVGPA